MSILGDCSALLSPFLPFVILGGDIACRRRRRDGGHICDASGRGLKQSEAAIPYSPPPAPQSCLRPRDVIPYGPLWSLGISLVLKSSDIAHQSIIQTKSSHESNLVLQQRAFEVNLQNVRFACFPLCASHFTQVSYVQ